MAATLLAKTGTRPILFILAIMAGTALLSGFLGNVAGSVLASTVRIVCVCVVVVVCGGGGGGGVCVCVCVCVCVSTYAYFV
jgi:hypothetical protein